MSYQLDALKEFSKIPVLSSLSEAEIFDFIRLCKVQRLGKGEALFEQGDDGRSMYIIESGRVEIFLERDHGRELIAYFEGLSVIGEVALIDPGPRSATAIASDETVLYEVLGDDFERMLQSYHPAAYKIIQQLSRVVCRRIRTVNERIEAELTGAPKPDPHTGEFDSVRGARQRAARATGANEGISTSGQRPAVGPGKPSVGASPGRPTSTNTSGMFKRVLSKFWGSDE